MDAVRDVCEKVMNGVDEKYRKELSWLIPDDLHLTLFNYFTYVFKSTGAENEAELRNDPVWSNAASLEKAKESTRRVMKTLYNPSVDFRRVILGNDGSLVLSGIDLNGVIPRLRGDVDVALREEGMPLSWNPSWVHMKIGMLAPEFLQNADEAVLQQIKSNIANINQALNQWQMTVRWNAPRRTYTTTTANPVTVLREGESELATLQPGVTITDAIGFVRDALAVKYHGAIP